MRCSYCYYLGKGPEQEAVMSYEVLEELIRQIMRQNSGPVVSFTWHGGEPTLAGLDFFKKAVELQQKYLPRGYQVWNNLQTNGLLLNGEWCRFLRDYHFDVGLSIDGCAAVHDAQRHTVGGQPTFEKARAAVKRLQSYGIQPDLLCTVSSLAAEHPLEVYQGLKNLGTGWMQFIPIVVRKEDGSFAPETVAPEAYGNFLCTVFDEWLTHDLGRLDVQLFAESARVWAGGQASVCTMAPVCGQVLIAEHDGSVYSCDHFVDQEHYLGNWMETPIAELAGSEKQLTFGAAKQTALTEECRECPWLTVCRGGCLKDRFALSGSGEKGQYYLCQGLKQFFAHAHPKTQKVMELSRKGLSPQEIMKTIG